MRIRTRCFKNTRRVARDSRVKYRWWILQLLLDQRRPSYAGLRMEALERPDGGRIVRYVGRRVVAQEPPPGRFARPSAVFAFAMSSRRARSRRGWRAALPS